MLLEKPNSQIFFLFTSFTRGIGTTTLNNLISHFVHSSPNSPPWTGFVASGLPKSLFNLIASTQGRRRLQFSEVFSGENKSEKDDQRINKWNLWRQETVLANKEVTSLKVSAPLGSYRGSQSQKRGKTSVFIVIFFSNLNSLLGLELHTSFGASIHLLEPIDPVIDDFCETSTLW